MTNAKTFGATIDEVGRLAPHYKALSINTVFMDEREPIPWDRVISVQTGGSYRLGISTSQSVIAEHESGLLMQWFVNLEPRSANGSGRIQLDVDLIREIIDNCPDAAAASVREWCREAIEGVREHRTGLESTVAACREIEALFAEALAEGGAS